MFLRYILLDITENNIYNDNNVRTLIVLKHEVFPYMIVNRYDIEY